MKNILVLGMVLLCYAGCTKIGKTLTIKGRVLNPVTGKGIAGAEVWLQRNKGFLPGGVKTIKKATSDVNGNYEMNKASFRYLTLVCSTGENYYDIGWYEDGAPMKGQYRTTVKKFKTQHWDYHAVPYGNLQINIKNISCFDSNDKLSIFRTHSIADFYDGVPNPAVYAGCIDQIGNMNKAPMGWYKYIGTVTKNNIQIPIEDSVYLSEGETLVWDIYY